MKTNIEVTYWQGQDASYNEYNKLCLYWGGRSSGPLSPPFSTPMKAGVHVNW